MSEQRSGMSGLATRLYRGEAGIEVVGRRKLWFGIAGAVLLIAVISMITIGFKPGIEFSGGNEYRVPASAGSLAQVEDAVAAAVAEAGVEDGAILAGTQVGSGAEATYAVRTPKLDGRQTDAVAQGIASKLGIDARDISDSQVSEAWGQQVTQKALLGLVVFIAVVSVYLIIRFEWRMAAAAVASLLFDLVATAAVYSLVGFEVTPSTVIGFLTILGFALYDVVVVFDKVQENTRSITGSSTQTYAEATNLAINQTLMRSINTSAVALLPVGGLLFIGAGLLGAGTLKDLGLVLFIGMGTAFFSSLFFATLVLVTLKEQDPKIANHTKRVLSRRAGADKPSGDLPAQQSPALAGAGKTSAPKAGAKPSRPGKRR